VSRACFDVLGDPVRRLHLRAAGGAVLGAAAGRAGHRDRAGKRQRRKRDQWPRSASTASSTPSHGPSAAQGSRRAGRGWSSSTSSRSLPPPVPNRGRPPAADHCLAAQHGEELN